MNPTPVDRSQKPQASVLIIGLGSCGLQVLRYLTSLCTSPDKDCLERPATWLIITGASSAIDLHLEGIFCEKQNVISAQALGWSVFEDLADRKLADPLAWGAQGTLHERVLALPSAGQRSWFMAQNKGSLTSATYQNRCLKIVATPSLFGRTLGQHGKPLRFAVDSTSICCGWNPLHSEGKHILWRRSPGLLLGGIPAFMDCGLTSQLPIQCVGFAVGQDERSRKNSVWAALMAPNKTQAGSARIETPACRPRFLIGALSLCSSASQVLVARPEWLAGDKGGACIAEFQRVCMSAPSEKARAGKRASLHYVKNPARSVLLELRTRRLERILNAVELDQEWKPFWRECCSDLYPSTLERFKIGNSIDLSESLRSSGPTTQNTLLVECGQDIAAGLNLPKTRRSLWKDWWRTINNIDWVGWLRKFRNLVWCDLPPILQGTRYDAERNELFVWMESPRRAAKWHLDLDSPIYGEKICAILLGESRLCSRDRWGDARAWLAECLAGPAATLPSMPYLDVRRSILFLRDLALATLDQKSIPLALGDEAIEAHVSSWVQDLGTIVVCGEGQNSVLREFRWGERERCGFYLNRLFSYDAADLRAHAEGIAELGGLARSLCFAWLLLYNRMASSSFGVAILAGHDDSTVLSWALAFARLCGVEVEAESSDEVEAFLCETRKRSVIHLRTRLEPHEKAWNICHELAHKMLRHRPNSRYGLDSDRLGLHDIRFYERQEQAAEALASLWLHLFKGLAEIGSSLARADGKIALVLSSARFRRENSSDGRDQKERRQAG